VALIREVRDLRGKGIPILLVTVYPGGGVTVLTKSVSARDLATNLAHASHPQQFHA